MEQLDAEDSRLELAAGQAACLPHVGEDGDDVRARYRTLAEITTASRWFIPSEETSEEFYKSEWRSLFQQFGNLPGVKIESRESFLVV